MNGVGEDRDLGGSVREGLLEFSRAARRVITDRATVFVALPSIAVSVCLTIAAVSVIDRVLLTDPPFEEASRLVDFTEEVASTQPGARWALSAGSYLDYAEGVAAFDATAAYEVQRVDLGVDRPQRLGAIRATSNLLDVLGVTPRVGRGLGDSGVSEVVLTHGLWNRLYTGSDEIGGLTLSVDGRPHTVVGVLPPDVRIPHYMEGIDVILPLDLTGAEGADRSRFRLFGVGRLAPGATLDDARRQAARVAIEMEELHPDITRGRQPLMMPLLEVDRGAIRPVIFALTGGITLLLLIAGLKLANTFVVRALDQSGDTAIRRAIGASKARLAQGLLLEALALALAGAVLGTAAGIVCVALVTPLFPNWPPSLDEVGVSLGIVAVAWCVGLLGTLGCSLPALAHTLRSTENSLSRSQRIVGGSRVLALLRMGGAGVEIALAATLIVGAGLTARSLVNMLRTDLGYEPEGLIVAPLPRPSGALESVDGQLSFGREAKARLSAMAGVASVAVADDIARPREWVRLINAARPETESGSVQGPHRLVGPDYFEVTGIELVAGRFFTDRDVASEVAVSIVTTDGAERLFPDGDALGGRVVLDPVGGTSGPGLGVAREIVGIVRPVREFGPNVPTAYPVYSPSSQAPRSTLAVVVRASGDPRALITSVRTGLAQMAPSAPAPVPELVIDRLRQSRSTHRLLLALIGTFAASAGLLALFGIFGVTTYSVQRRSRELAIRAAMGATPRRLVLGVVLRGAGITAAGAFAGVLAGSWTARFLPAPRGSTFLYEVDRADPFTLGLAFLVLLALGAASSVVPGRRAAAADPIELMRRD